jgi:hypothetical protein
MHVLKFNLKVQIAKESALNRFIRQTFAGELVGGRMGAA